MLAANLGRKNACPIAIQYLIVMLEQILSLLKKSVADSRWPQSRQHKFATKLGLCYALYTLQRPEINGLDVSARLSELGWPAQWYFGSNFLNKLNEFTTVEKEKFIKERLLRKSEKYKSVGVVPNWTHAIHMTHEAIFPAGKTAEVIHHFNLPSASIDYSLRDRKIGLQLNIALVLISHKAWRKVAINLALLFTHFDIC